MIVWASYLTKVETFLTIIYEVFVLVSDKLMGYG